VGDRRMISKRICESAKFLKMPATSQNLYFHLMLNADDDGVVEAYPVMAVCKANEDDLKVLVGRQFVYVLNEDYVTYIEDWREINSIRPDRKVDSRYQSLLLSVRPELELLEKKQRSDVKKRIQKSGPSMDRISGPSTDSGWTEEVKSSQVKSSQDKLSQGNSIHLSIIDKKSGEKDGVMDGTDGAQEYRQIIADNIHLDWLKDSASRHGEKEVLMVDEIYETICDMVCNPRDKVKIKNTEYPWTVVKSQYLKLNYQHIANILNRIIDADLKIKNMNAYLISTLYTESMSGILAEEAELHDGYLKSLRGQPY